MSRIGEKDGIIKMREGWGRGNRGRKDKVEERIGQREQGKKKKG